MGPTRLQKRSMSHDNPREAKRQRRQWVGAEDEVLKMAVAKTEGKSAGEDAERLSWVAVAEHVPGRTPKQCRDRWQFLAKPVDQPRQRWTAAEDKLLLELHSALGNRWVLIAKEFEGRNDNMCKSRFRSLTRNGLANSPPPAPETESEY